MDQTSTPAEPAAAPDTSGVPRWTKNPDGTYTLPLLRPFTVGERDVRALTLREPEAGDMRGLPEQGRTMGHQLDVIARISGEHPHVINKLKLADLAEVSAFIESF